MLIYGEKIYLRAIEKSDNELLRQLMNDPDTELMLSGKSFPVSGDSQLKWFENLGSSNELRFIIAERASDEAVGTVILSDIDRINGTAEIHIKLRAESRCKGFGSDCVRTLVGYAVNELRLNCIYANILEYNTASRLMFEKCGFVREGIMRERVYKNGKYVNVLAYSILRDEIRD